MDIKLTEHNQAFIQQELEAGRYPDLESALNRAVAVLEERTEENTRLRELRDRGMASFERGDFYELTDELIREINDEANRDAGSGKPVRAHVRP